ncbi:MAG: diguanylate cyclase/phosphodiesterase with sensor(s) [Moraxellaceae bacterium]|jgi:diguanylate cyclase (GGDEF)-like protein/PAS domain S-box-containing protein|nr:diguanylate cyclase/phosphodiesterase with sensor(s) [Moraxellaceae bacterium]
MSVNPVSEPLAAHPRPSGGGTAASGETANTLEIMQNRQIYDQLPAFIAVSTFSAFATVALYWNDALVNRLHLEIWLGLFLGFMLLRTAVVWKVRRNMPDSTRLARNLVTLSAAITGVFWGVACVLFNPIPFPAGPESGASFFQQALFGALLGSQGIAALACYAASFPSFLAFVSTSLVPSLIYALLQPSPVAHLVAGIGGLLLVFLLATSRRLNATTLSSLRLRLRNEDLISFLETSKKEMESINQKLALEIYDRKNAEVRLQEMNDNLERKVAERTQALSTLNDALRQSQERLSLAIDASGIGLWDWHLPSDDIYHSNFEQLLGYSSKELTGFMGHLKPLVHPDDYQLVKKAIVLHLRKRTPIYHVQYRMKHRRGHWIWVEDNGRVVAWNEEGRAIRMIGTRRDITKERELEQRLRLAASVFHHAAEAVFILDRELRYVSINPGFTQITGYTESETLGSRITDLRPHCPEVHSTYLQIAQALEKQGEWQGEFTEYRKNGEAFPEWLHLTAVRDENGDVTHYIGLFNDMTARREAEERLRYLSNYDKLTGFANRNLFRDRLHAAISRARDGNHQVALLYIDLDRFRQINDTLGHEVGDELLKKAGKRISSVDASIDTISRIGGDEFTIILDNYQDRAELEHFCERIIAELRRPFRIGEHELLLGASIGISIFPENGRELQILLNHADIAMHQAKRLGGNTTKFYTADLRVASIEQLNLETSLRKAIFRDEFVVHYQPKMDLRTNRIVGVEALVRWAHPSLGLLYPGDFIPLAEETGLVSAIGELVLDKACRQAQQWKEMGLGDIRTSVNIPAHQVRKGNLAQVIKRVLDNSGLDPTLLELELTESSLMEESESVLTMLNELRGRGIVISLDDFGTGYSSLSYLKRFPIDVLKIDQAFIRDIGTNPGDEAITRAIIAMAHSMKMEVVAEGVETEKHLDFLRKEGCDYIQGYLLSRPIPDQELSQLLRRQG